MDQAAKQDATPTVSRRLPDGRLVELVYDAAASETRLAVGGPGEAPTLTDRLVLASGEELTPYSARNNLIVTGCVLLPSAVGDYGTKAELLAEVKTYLHRYVDLSPLFEDLAAHYALLSWVYDAFNELPYLRFRGEFGTGKTRALLALGSICYKPFFASGASTVSPIFHILDVFRGTLVLDEADFRFSDATAGLTKILNNGTVAGLPVLRTMTNRAKELDPRAFRVFGPKLVAMREHYSDRALESRFLTEETGLRPLRSDVPIAVTDQLAADALRLRNKLLAWRLREHANIRVDPTRAGQSVHPRLNQMALPLLSIINDPAVRAALQAELKREHARLAEDARATPDALMVAALASVFEKTPPGQVVTLTRVTTVFNAQAAEGLGRTVSYKWAGWFLRTRLKLATERRHGVFVIPERERGKVAELAARYGLNEDRRAA